MTFTRGLFAFLTYSAVIMAPHCKADRPPPPTGLTYEWLDPFVVNVSWAKPVGLPDDAEVKYKIRVVKNGKEDVTCTTCRHITKTWLTEELDSDWMYNISTVGSLICDSVNESTPVSITIRSEKPRAELVKDFKCLADSKKRNCSWKSVNESLELKLSYRVCGHSKESIKPLRSCDQPYSSGTEKGCYLNATVEDDICILVDSDAGMSTFKPELVIPSPKLHITEENNELKLSWTPPEFGKSCDWTYVISFSECNNATKNLSYTVPAKEEHMTHMNYAHCLYKFKSKVTTDKTCLKVSSDYGEVVTYGTNKPPDRTLTVVAIVIPVILFICVILSCYCFRRHSAIICPIVPDPSAIFKEMMMNGNKELKPPTGSLYTPMPEPIEPCNITLVTESTALKQNS